MRWRALAPGKVNLCLFLGGTRPDARHELVTVFESVSLADELDLQVLQEGPDEVVCPALEGENLVWTALERLRSHGWAGPPVRITLSKWIPVAGGMGGGSADAAATLRLAAALAPLGDGLALELAAGLGADVPSQLAPGVALGTGAGDRIEVAPSLAEHAFVIIPQDVELSTASVYAAADRLRLGRSAEELAALGERVRAELVEGAHLPSELLVNDLEPASLSLCPRIADALEAARSVGADDVLVCGSGPTVAGVFWGAEAAMRAADSEADLAGRYPEAYAADPVGPAFGAPLRA